MDAKRDTIRMFILQNYLFTEDQSALQDDTSFLESGIVDSTGMMEVIFFLEESWGIKVEDEEMIPENLDSVSNLVAFLKRKQGQAA
jgi:acyl carrier protein